MLQDPLGHHDLFAAAGGVGVGVGVGMGVGVGVGELKPSVASLQATVMSNAAAAYQSMGLPHGGVPSSHDQGLLHDYHSL